MNIFPELQFQLVMSGAAAKMSALSIEVPNDSFEASDHSTVREKISNFFNKSKIKNIAPEKLK